LLGASNWFSLGSPFPNSLGAGFWLVVLRGCSWEFRAGVYAGGLCVWVVFLAGHCAFFLWVGLISSGISAMERNFTVESKSFSLSVLEGASMVRVEEKRKSFVGVIVLSTRCSDWLASTLETLLGFSGDHDFVKSFKEGSKLLIAQRGENKAGRFLEAAAYGLGGRRGLILIPEGRGGWGWRKFSSELRIVSVSLSAGCGLGLSASNKKDGKVEGAKLSTCLDSLGAT
jgi:hypothetical protein